MDGSGAWWNHSGHLATSSRSLITSLRIHLGGMSSGIGTSSMIVNIDLKGCKLASQVDRCLFFLRAKRGHKVVDYNYYYYFPTLTHGVKPLGLILVIALIGVFDLSSTLASTPSVK